MDTVIEIQDNPSHGGRRCLLLDARAALDAVLNHPQCPVFLQSALRGKLSWQKRSEYSVAKALTAPSLAPQVVGALLAWGVWAVLEEGEQRLLAEVLETPGKAKAVEALSVPLDVPGRAWAEARTGSNPQDFPIVWAMAVVDLEDGNVQSARIALSGAWRQSVALVKSAGLLVGHSLDEQAIGRAVAAVEEEVAPVGDYRGGEAYRRAMAGVMTRRALEACLEGVEA